MPKESGSMRHSVVAALKYLPHSVRIDLVARREFSEKHSLARGVQVSLANGAVRFQRQDLYAVLRASLREPGVAVRVADERQREWEVAFRDDWDLPRFQLSSLDDTMTLPATLGLESDEALRVRRFEREAEAVNLPEATVGKWRSLLRERSLSDDEIDDLRSGLENTPVAVLNRIRAQLMEGACDIDTLVPTNLAYYEQLVGRYDNQTSFVEYRETSLVAHVRQLLGWRPLEGALIVLALSSFPELAAAELASRLSDDDLSTLASTLTNGGDRVSQVGLFELLLPVLGRVPQLEPELSEIARAITGDSERPNPLGLTSSLIVLVGGELARTRVLSEKPPFWRRLAVITQAALVERLCRSYGMNEEGFSDWALASRGRWFFHQVVCELRVEPRWQADYVSPNQLQAECAGRILAVSDRPGLLEGREQLRAVLSEEPAQRFRESLTICYPGPLEGALPALNPVPEEISHEIESRLAAEELDASTFVPLANAGILFAVPPKLASSAADGLKRSGEQIVRAGERGELRAAVVNLAQVAAVTRSTELASELRVFARRARRATRIQLSVTETLNAALVASAACEDLAGWCDMVGAWLTELAFECEEKSEIDNLRIHIQGLCSLVPELQRTVGRASAALEAAAAVESRIAPGLF